MVLASVVRVPSPHSLSSIPLCGQLLARNSALSKLPFFWAAVPLSGNIQGSFKLAFDNAGMTCKGTGCALEWSAVLVPSWAIQTTRSNHEGTCMIYDLHHCYLCREKRVLLSGLLGGVGLFSPSTLNILSRICTGLGQKATKCCEPEHTIVS